MSARDTHADTHHDDIGYHATGKGYLVGFLLSVGASFGAVTAVFEWGWLAEELHVPHVGPVISFMPIILMGVLFGLAMDYEVFLVARMREDWVHHGEALPAVRRGFASSARVVVVPGEAGQHEGFRAVFGDERADYAQAGGNHAYGEPLNDEQFELGLRSIAVPVRNVRGEVLLAIGIGTHSARMQLAQLAPKLLPELQQGQRILASIL